MADKLNILVIDDKKAIGDFFDFTLGFSGHRITVIDNTAEALKAIKEKAFDIVFLDIVMPEKDGVEVLKEIKQINPGLAVAMMSGYAVEDKKLQAQQAGAVDCLRKPFDIEDIKKVIKKATGKEV